MRGIRIWHLAALALSLPLLTAAVPSGCTGGLNPNFRGAIGQGAGSAIPIPTGYLLLGIFNETGYTGHFDFTVSGKSWASAWKYGFDITEPVGLAWACDISSIAINGGEVLAPDTSGALTLQPIAYNGGALAGNRQGDPLECGTLVKAMIIPLVTAGSTTITYHCFVDILK